MAVSKQNLQEYRAYARRCPEIRRELKLGRPDASPCTGCRYILRLCDEVEALQEKVRNPDSGHRVTEADNWEHGERWLTRGE